MSNRNIIIGTRGSELALWQAHHIEHKLIANGLKVTIKIIKTKGDKIQDLSFDKIEGKGFFTKELQDALLNQEIDLAVHSHKDLETTEPLGLCIAAVTEREEANEVLIIKNEFFDPHSELHLPKNAIVGTSSIRRKMILGQSQPDIQFVDLRGNVPTRIQKLRDHPWHAIVLAKAGLNRISPSMDGLTPITLDATIWVPAPAQGALALECRDNDDDVKDALAFLHHNPTAQAIHIERSILRGIGGGCQVPLAAYARFENELWHVETVFTNSLEEAAQRIRFSHAHAENLPSMVLQQLQIQSK
jgi:hydroxymethylbilane synthase